MGHNLILGLDIGTSAVKAIFMDLESREIHKDEEKISTLSAGLISEQNAEDYLSAIKIIANRNTDRLNFVSAIGLSGQTPSVVCIDEEGIATYPVMIWQDNRATLEASELEAKFGNPIPIIGTSLPWSASACPAKLFWLSKHEGEVLNKTRWVLQPKDYVGFHLTQLAISDPWSTKGLCNTRTLKPTAELLTYIGWQESVVPELAAGESSRGNVTELGHQRSGLPAGIPVSVGWSDAMCGMLALGVMTEPTSFIITGTSAIVGSSQESEVNDAGTLYVIPKSCAPLSVTYGPTQMSGGSIAWAAQLFGVSENEIVTEGASDTAETVPIFLPYLRGERAPLWRNDISGKFVNIKSEHNRSSFCRATMEGISFAERQVLELSEKLNDYRGNYVALGGHAGNDQRWERIRARTLGRKIKRFEDVDTTTHGAAILAHAMQVGISKAYSDLAVMPLEIEPTTIEKEYAVRNFEDFLQEQNYLIMSANQKASV